MIDRRALIGTILRELDRQRDQEPVFPLPFIGDLEEDGTLSLEGIFNVHQLADAILKDLTHGQ